MKSTPSHRAALAAMLLLATSALWAQNVYRSVDPSGRITYSDQPPVAAAAPERKSAAVTSGSDDVNAALPYLLRQATAAFPVTLYTGPSCGEPCNTARTLLVRRGVPFSEMTVSTQQDVDALQRLSGQASLPFLTIGGQHLRGFSDSDWNQYLSAAGYPASSQLPANYRNAPATALTPLPATPAEPTRTQGAPAVAPPQPQNRTPSNPAGIQF